MPCVCHKRDVARGLMWPYGPQNMIEISVYIEQRISLFLLSFLFKTADHFEHVPYRGPCLGHMYTASYLLWPIQRAMHGPNRGPFLPRFISGPGLFYHGPYCPVARKTLMRPVYTEQGNHCNLFFGRQGYWRAITVSPETLSSSLDAA